MGSTSLSLHYHIVFSTKNRQPLIATPWREVLHAYLGGTVRGLGGVPEEIGGVADHVHLLVGLKATHCMADFLRELKKSSSNWAAEREPSFGWQDGYAAFTVSASQIATVRHYIANQEDHHRTMTYHDELTRLLEKHGIEYDPKYLV